MRSLIRPIAARLRPACSHTSICLPRMVCISWLSGTSLGTGCLDPGARRHSGSRGLSRPTATFWAYGILARRGEIRAIRKFDACSRSLCGLMRLAADSRCSRKVSNESREPLHASERLLASAQGSKGSFEFGEDEREQTTSHFMDASSHKVHQMLLLVA